MQNKKTVMVVRSFSFCSSVANHILHYIISICLANLCRKETVHIPLNFEVLFLPLPLYSIFIQLIINFVAVL